jgi:hypothetical protein
MDRLTRYLIMNYSRLMTIPEHAAYRAVALSEKAASSSSPAIGDRLESSVTSGDPVVRGLLEGGPQAFFDRLRNRLMSEHREEIVLTCCPRCGALARTPQAKQCPDCYHSWHETEQ